MAVWQDGGDVLGVGGVWGSVCVRGGGGCIEGRGLMFIGVIMTTLATVTL